MPIDHRRSARPAAALRAAAAGFATLVLSAGVAEARPLSILSLDQCADQFVLAMREEGDRLTLSPRADDADSYMREAAAGHRLARPGLEAVVMARPDVVVRYWGGDPALLRGLERRGLPVVTIADATDFETIRTNVRGVAEELGRPEAAEPLVARMDDDLKAASRARARGAALYLTSGGFTAGAGTLIDAMLTAAGLRNAAPAPGFGPVSIERLVMQPPARFVLGFFDDVRRDRRGPGRHPALARRMAERPTVSLPASELSCPAWFAASAARRLAEVGE